MKVRKNNVFRVLRGSSYIVDPRFMTFYGRNADSPASRGRYWNFGFRLVVRKQS